ncbi:MAG: succinate dehydrogenase [Nitrososphaerales archaeon]
MSRKRHKTGIKAWLKPYGYSLERWSYFFQRVSGVVLLLYFIGHVIETGTITGGFEVWLNTLNFTQNPFGHAILLIVILSGTFHAINGIRLYLTHQGYLLGKPERPEYPYYPKSFSRAQRVCFWLSVSIALVFFLYGFNILFGE